MKAKRLPTRLTASIRGFTLIEVVVGLMLLGTLLVSLLLALARHKRFTELADNRQTAVQIADQLLARWVDSPKGIPLSKSGRIAGRPDWFWRTAVISNGQIFGVPASIIRLEVVHTRLSSPRTVLVGVDTVVASRGGASQ